MEKLYTSGKAAEFLTDALGRPFRRRHIRELCRHGLAEGAYLNDRTGHWMIPMSTIDKWQRARQGHRRSPRVRHQPHLAGVRAQLRRDHPSNPDAWPNPKKSSRPPKIWRLRNVGSGRGH